MNDLPRMVVGWYLRHRRDLPWRVGKGYPDAYHVLLSELMLQQTQVATVVPYFLRFVERFPTIKALAEGQEAEVLRHWQGLGYYSRARHLHSAAKQIVQRHAACVPDSLHELLQLPGVGRYTAGAIASLAFGRRAPIVDGNVQRVFCRVAGLRGDPRTKRGQERLWRLAEQMLPEENVAEYNSGLMELGAEVCTPKNPACSICPIQRHCRAFERGQQHQIPRPRKAMSRPIEKRWVFCIERHGAFLIQQRPPKGRWAGLWQFLTVPARSKEPDLSCINDASGVSVRALRALGEIRHDLTHRRYEFSAWACRAAGGTPHAGLCWVASEQLRTFPMSKPQLRIAELAMGQASPPGALRT